MRPQFSDEYRASDYDRVVKERDDYKRMYEEMLDMKNAWQERCMSPGTADPKTHKNVWPSHER